jgi:hypothetical protein
MRSSIEYIRDSVPAIESQVGRLLLTWLENRTSILLEDLSCPQEITVMLRKSTSFVCLKHGHHGAATLMRFPM